MKLKRIAYTEHGTFGVLLENGIPFAVTIELPWRDNKPFVSCIPTGQYACKRFKRSSGKITWEVTGVEGRYAILFHAANTVTDLRGCVGVAKEFGILRGKPAVLSSGRGFEEFMDKTTIYQEFTLFIEGEPNNGEVFD